MHTLTTQRDIHNWRNGGREDGGSHSTLSTVNVLTFNVQLDGLLRQQSGVARADQLLATGLTRKQIVSQVEARRWQRYGDHCIVTHNFVPTRRQRM